VTNPTYEKKKIIAP